MKKIIIIIMLMSIFPLTQIKSQDANDGFMSHAAIGLSTSIQGVVGINAHLSLLPQLKARVGFNYMPTEVFDFNRELWADSYDGTQTSVVSVKLKSAYVHMSNLSCFFDFFPSKNSSFSITAGFYAGKYRMGVDVTANQPFSYTFLPDVAPLKVEPPANGKIDAYIGLGNQIKPYLGIGFGNTIPNNSKWAFRFDMGVLYFGSLYAYCDRVREGNKKVDAIDFVKSLTQIDESYHHYLDLARTILTFTPNIQLTLAYKIF